MKVVLKVLGFRVDESSIQENEEGEFEYDLLESNLLCAIDFSKIEHFYRNGAEEQPYYDDNGKPQLSKITRVVTDAGSNLNVLMDVNDFSKLYQKVTGEKLTTLSDYDLS